MSKLLWNPTEKGPNAIKSTNIYSFISVVNQTYATKIKNYKELYKWSISNLSDFWETLWYFSGIKYSVPFKTVVNDINKFPGTEWFPKAKLNFAENLLRYKDKRTALVFRGEARDHYKSRLLTYAQLYVEVTQVASSLRKMGVATGDRVVAYMPNIFETVITMLACTSIGAIWASCGAELGASAVIDRLGQVKPKILFTVDGYFYKGKKFSILENVIAIAQELKSLEKIVVYPFMEISPDIAKINNSVLWDNFIDHTSNDLIFEQLPFNHPLYIMFSSGTTGKPKSMVQSAGGVLINHLKELLLHTDLKRSDTICYVTSPSWMMWNWLVTSLAVGASIVLFNGNPSYPDWKKIWSIIYEEKITIFGTSASYIYYLMKSNFIPKDNFDLGSLRQISQTASSLSEEGFEFVYSAIKADLHFNSISGGTDINGCFAAGSPISPVYAGEIQSPALAMKIKAYDDQGNSLYDKQGELVCESPSPSMPLYFWDDPDFTRYKKAYFDHYKDIRNVWRHGDYVEIHKETYGITFHGRSDAVLKPSGVRIGTAEIYNVVELLPEIDDSVAIGQQWQGDQRIILFVKLKPKFELTEELIQKIKNSLRENASPRHVPSLIVEVSAIPYTFSNKKVEIAISNLAHGREITNRDALANPESLDFYEQFFQNMNPK